MKKELFQNIEIPEGIEVKIEENTLIVKGPEGENKRTFNINKLVFEKKGNQIIIGSKEATKKEKKMMNTITTHIKNMFKGLQKKFEYKLKICFSHFPITVKIENNEGIIKNFLGEKIPRKSKIPKGVDVKIDKEIIKITSFDKELAGQTAANFERATKIRMKDRRVFQDGIFIINKAGREI
jgi:large subunit ribosomal protein L6